MLVDSPNEFFTYLRGDLFALKRKAVRMSTKSRKYKVGFRLNVLSDVPWESVFPTIFSEFDTVQFIDYTKTWGRLFTKLPANYHLTYSVNEKTPAGVVARIYNETNYNCAVVFNTAKGDDLPRFHTNDGITFRVIDGDKHDLRHTDPRRKDGYPCLVGLRYKRAFKLSRGKERGGMVRPKVAKSGTFVILAD